MIGMLQVVIGLIFVLFLFSLLAIMMMEFVVLAFFLCGCNLEKVLCNMFVFIEVDDQLVVVFKDNVLYKQFFYKYGKKCYFFFYFSDCFFQFILMEIILNGEGFDCIEERLDILLDVDLKNVLKQFFWEFEYDVEVFKGKVCIWYNDVMDCVLGWYKCYI